MPRCLSDEEHGRRGVGVADMARVAAIGASESGKTGCAELGASCRAVAVQATGGSSPRRR